MILIVGLGNPGKKYEKTRHNIGFRVIDALENEISDENVILFKPQTFMNNSGRAVKKLIASPRLVGLGPKNLYVIHDDIDLPLGTIRISRGSSSGGHRGVQSIINALETKDFIRFRIGVRGKLKEDAEIFVLKNFSKEEEKIVEKVIKKVVELIKESLKTGIKKTTIKI